MTQLNSILKTIDKSYTNINQVKEQDLEVIKEFTRLDNEDRKDDSQRLMTWFALAGMIFYPLVIVACDAFGLDRASDAISDMADMYFISVSAIVMAFFGANAWSSVKTRAPRPRRKSEMDEEN